MTPPVRCAPCARGRGAAAGRLGFLRPVLGSSWGPLHPRSEALCRLGRAQSRSVAGISALSVCPWDAVSVLTNRDARVCVLMMDSKTLF